MSDRTRTPEHTQMVPAPAFSKTGRVWKPFRFTNLEKVSKRHAQLARNLEWMLPNVRSTGEVATSGTQAPQRAARRDHLASDRVRACGAAVSTASLRGRADLVVLAPYPHKTRGLLEVELGLAHRAIDLLLGGAGDAVSLRPLTDIEEGVMTYVLIETLKALSPTLDPSLPKLRIESMVRSFDEVQSLIGEDESVAVVQLKAHFGAHTGYLRLFIPEVVLAAANPPVDAAIRRERRRTDALANAARLRNVVGELRVEIGQVRTSAAIWPSCASATWCSSTP